MCLTHIKARPRFRGSSTDATRRFFGLSDANKNRLRERLSLKMDGIVYTSAMRTAEVVEATLRPRSRERSTNRWIFLGTVKHYERPRSELSFRSPNANTTHVNQTEKGKRRNSLTTLQIKLDRVSLDRHPFVFYPDPRSRAYVCKTCLAVTSFFTYSGFANVSR